MAQAEAQADMPPAVAESGSLSQALEDLSPPTTPTVVDDESAHEEHAPPAITEVDGTTSPYGFDSGAETLPFVPDALASPPEPEEEPLDPSPVNQPTDVLRRSWDEVVAEVHAHMERKHGSAAWWVELNHADTPAGVKKDISAEFQFMMNMLFYTGDWVGAAEVIWMANQQGFQPFLEPDFDPSMDPHAGMFVTDDVSAADDVAADGKSPADDVLVAH